MTAENTNYCAEVVEVKHLVPLEGLDNLVGLPVGGYQALVPKDTPLGSLMVVFPAESRLSPEFLSANNLYRHNDLNADNTKTGYIEDNGRVKAIRLRGHTSNALALGVESITEFLLNGNNPSSAVGALQDLTPGLLFDTIDGVQIVKKYEIPVRGGSLGKSAQEKIWRRVDDKFLPEHVDTENWWRNEFKIADDDFVVVTQKLHGSSIRIANTYVKRKPTWKDRVAKWFGLSVPETEFAHVYGSRKVIKDPSNPLQNHYYDYDLWSEEGQRYDDLIPPGIVVYGELVGFTKDGGPIQKNYTYEAIPGTADLFVYRVAVVTADGHLYDLPWRGVEEFCWQRGLKTVPVLWSGLRKDFVAEDWLDRRFRDEGFAQAVQLSDKKLPDEGVVIRRDGLLPLVLKAKSPRFLEHETKIADTGEADLESVGSAA